MKNEKIRKLILSISTIAVLVALAVLITACGDPTPTETIEITYTENEDTVEITGYEGVLSPEATLDIPSIINGKPVDSISAGAFSGKEDLVNVFIPASITKIGEGAFENCKSLVTVNLPNRISSIPSSAFSGCDGLKSIIIPGNITSIGDKAFAGCKSLEKITVSKNTTEIGKDVFKGCKNIKVAEVPTWVLGMLNTKKLEALTITGGEAINTSDMKNVSALKKVYIPDYVTSIDDDVFCDASDIEELTAPGWSLPSFSLSKVRILNVIGEADISAGMLRNSKNIEKLTLPYIGAAKDSTSPESSHIGYIFGAADASANAISVPRSLKSVVITNATVVADKAFYGCTSITSVILPSFVNSIGEEAFYGCTSLTSVNIPANATRIGRAAFCETNIEEAIIPDGITTIEEKVFYNCDNLKSLTIGRSVTSVKNSAFDSCDALDALYIYDIEKWCMLDFDTYYNNPLFYATKLYVNGELINELVIPETITEIKNNTFFRCTNVKQIILNGNVTKIGDYSFAGCISLETIVIPGTVKSIGRAAFSNCENLKDIVIPESVESIGAYAFNLCSSLKTVELNANITEIAENTFKGCSAINTLNVSDTVTAVNSDAFAGCEKIKFIKAPVSVLKNLSMRNAITVSVVGSGVIESAIFAGTDVISVVIGNDITAIADGAFAGCLELEDVSISTSANLSRIGANAFADCYKLTTVIIPASVTEIGEGAFDGCYRLAVAYNLSILNAENSIPYAYKVLTDINENAGYTEKDGYLFLENGNETLLIGYFGNRNSLELPAIANGYVINEAAFIGLGLMSISVPECATVNALSFKGCDSLTSITANVDVLKYIEKANVTSITVTGGDMIKKSDIDGCTKLTAISIANSITAIEAEAFELFEHIESIEVEDNNTAFKVIGGALYSADEKTLYKAASNITRFDVPATVERIGDYAFAGCIDITDIFFDDEAQIMSIGNFAFKNCKNLFSVAIPATVTEIGTGIFYGCSGLRQISVDEANTKYKAIDGCLVDTNAKAIISVAVSFSIPTDENVTAIGEYAFAGNEGITSINISGFVTEIADTAFFGTELYQITVDESNTAFKVEEGKLIEIATGTVKATLAD